MVEDRGQMREAVFVLPAAGPNGLQLISDSAISGCGELGQLRPTVAAELRRGPSRVFLHLRTCGLGDGGSGTLFVRRGVFGDQLAATEAVCGMYE